MERNVDIKPKYNENKTHNNKQIGNKIEIMNTRILFTSSRCCSFNFFMWAHCPTNLQCQSNYSALNRFLHFFVYDFIYTPAPLICRLLFCFSLFCEVLYFLFCCLICGGFFYHNYPSKILIGKYSLYEIYII